VDISKVGPVQRTPVFDMALPKLPLFWPTTVIKSDESIAVPLGCRRDVNAPEFIIAGVLKVTAGEGGPAGSEVIEIPLPISIPGPIVIAISYLSYTLFSQDYTQQKRLRRAF
jgi:hypothetical protein